jgi:uncharacterized protein
VKQVFAGERRAFLLGLVVLLVVVMIRMGGCEKSKSAGEAPAKVHAIPKEHGASRSANPSTSHNPRLAIILDDLGSDPAAADAIFSLPYPLTLSILPNHPHSRGIAEEAHRRGYQVLLHLPMQPLGNETSESPQLQSGMTSAEVSRVLVDMLASVPNAAGVNNHQGSLATSDAQLMTALMPILRDRDLFFIDSRTTAATLAFNSAQNAGVRCAFRNVPFLDDSQDVNAIRRQLQLAIRGAKEKREAIAIGHPHPETLRALQELLPQAEAQGVRLVPVADLVH